MIQELISKNGTNFDLELLKEILISKRSSMMSLKLFLVNY